MHATACAAHASDPPNTSAMNALRMLTWMLMAQTVRNVYALPITTLLISARHMMVHAPLTVPTALDPNHGNVSIARHMHM